MEKLMANTIYATFATESDAERASGALMDHGVQAADISFVLPEHPAFFGEATAIPSSRSVDTLTPPMNYDLPAIDVPIPGPPQPVNIEYGTRPAESNLGVETGFRDPNPPMAMGTSIQETVTIARTATIPADTDIDTVEHERRSHIVDMGRQEPNAATGISTTTAGDAGKGALEGAAMGVGLGILLGLAVIAIPGVGLVAGTGALIAGLAAATGAAGGIAGGVYGYLADLGVPAANARVLSDHLEAGGLILGINVTGDVRQDEIVELLGKYNATSIQAF
jgi:hypothetical protein